MTTHKRFGIADLRRIRAFATREHIALATRRATVFVLLAYLALIAWAAPDLIEWITSWGLP
jgi:hypothetical protein